MVGGVGERENATVYTCIEWWQLAPQKIHPNIDARFCRWVPDCCVRANHGGGPICQGVANHLHISLLQTGKDP